MKHPIPDAALDDRLGFVGTAGSGKTYNASACVERLLDKGARVVVVDPLDVWWGLRLIADGSAPSRYSMPIFGGAHGDLPLNEHAGALIGETVAGMAESCVVSLGGLSTKSAERRFMLAFLDTIYRKASGEPVHIIFDEADLWAPQKSSEPMLQSRMEEICRRGRVKGLIPWLISQRPAVISKDVLSQVDGLIAFKLTSSQDRDALEGWIEGQADRQQWKEIRAQLPTLQQGSGVVWVPGRGVLETMAFPPKRTFDSSRTPKRGEKKRTAALKPIDLGALKERLSKVETETKANDPAALKAEVTKLKRELAGKSSASTVDPQEVHAAYGRGKVDGYADAIKGVSAEFKEVIGALHMLERQFAAIRSSAAQVEEWAKRPAPEPTRAMPRLTPQAKPRAAAAPLPKANGQFNRAQHRVLRSLAMWLALGHATPSREMVAAASGYSPSSGNFNNLLGGLSTAGAIGKPMPGHVSLLMDADTMTAEEGRDMLLGHLNGPQRKLIDALNGTGDISRDDLGTATDYSSSSGNFNNLIGSLSTLGIITKPAAGYVALSEWAQELLG